ncbi:hypothetical protein CPB83DRAFT_785538 [Crepidotus variabilis]|uniref:SMP-LTD domain-containing protein n=1 Tax=Crepidotus variabilis TaxID=179855 RepID=A0A9P6EMV3_9AGAR|nr:hypothetical protein CPB83DRAFT_785538 [Crepidotus variabilis]
MFRALLYAYVLGGLTFIPLVIFALFFVTVYTSVPVGDLDVSKKTRGRREAASAEEEEEPGKDGFANTEEAKAFTDALNDLPRTRKAWLTMRRTFEETAGDGSYVTLVRSFLDSRSKDPKKSRPKDMWYVVLKGTVLYLYEDEDMSECEAAIELSGHQVVIYPEDLPDAELFAKRNAICLKPKVAKPMPSITKKMKLKQENVDEVMNESPAKGKRREAQREALLEEEKQKDAAREQAMDPDTPWFIFVRSNVEMEDWYFSLIHGSEQPAQTPTLQPLHPIFGTADMNHLVSTLDQQPDVIPMRWLNALLGRIFFSHYRTQHLESYIIGRLMKKLSKVKRPAFLTEIEVTEVSVGDKAPMLSKPMLKELTKEGDASIEVHLQYKGEIRITVEATAVINLGARFKSYTVKLTLAAVLKELEGNLLIKVKRPPSNRIWYAFTASPRIVLEVEPIVSDRQLTWGMILSTIESKFKEIIQESVVMPNMDDIAFFDTELYEHRGGIWSDACRKPREPTAASAVPDDAQSTASAPVLETTASNDPTSMTVSVPDDASIQSSPPSMVVPDAESVSTSNLERVDSIASDASKSTRRRTWFASVLPEDAASASAPSIISSSPNGTISSDEAERGRSLKQEKGEQPRTKSSSLSEPLPVIVDSTQMPTEAQVLSLPSPASNSSRRSVSQHSTKLNQDGDESDPSISRPKSSPNTPRKNSDASQLGRAPSPPSFFSTLKSKAGDKQAISNTAKEAMLKWGVKWGGFKKEPNHSQQSSEEGTGGSPPRVGLLQAEEVNGNTNKAPTHKPRASYAEVRAAVAERLGQRGPVSSSREELAEDTGLISPETTARLRVTSNPGLPFSANTENLDDSPSVSSSTAARASTPLKATPKKSFPSIGSVNTGETDEATLTQPQDATSSPEIPIKPAPIHVQPVAKTMSIPGIHVSHRGEVQSMGYVAPPQSPPPAASNGPVTEAMLKMPDLHKMYRFLKPNNQQASGPTSGLGTSRQELYRARDDQVDQEGVNSAEASDEHPGGTASAGPELVSPSQTSLKTIPPPLPPRSSPKPMLSASPNVNQNGPSNSPPRVSEFLRTIVQKDDRNRLQVASPAHDVFSSDFPSTSDSLRDEDADANEVPESTGSDDSAVLRVQSASVLKDLPITNGAPPPLPPRKLQAPAV